MEADFTRSHYFRVKVICSSTRIPVAGVKPPLLEEPDEENLCSSCTSILALLKFSWRASEQRDLRAIYFHYCYYPTPPASSSDKATTTDFLLHGGKCRQDEEQPEHDVQASPLLPCSWGGHITIACPSQSWLNSHGKSTPYSSYSISSVTSCLNSYSTLRTSFVKIRFMSRPSPHRISKEVRLLHWGYGTEKFPSPTVLSLFIFISKPFFFFKWQNWLLWLFLFRRKCC